MFGEKEDGAALSRERCVWRKRKSGIYRGRKCEFLCVQRKQMYIERN